MYMCITTFVKLCNVIKVKLNDYYLLVISQLIIVLRLQVSFLKCICMRFKGNTPIYNHLKGYLKQTPIQTEGPNN